MSLIFPVHCLATDAAGLTVTVGQFLGFISALIVAGAAVFGFVLRNSLDVNSLKKDVLFLQESKKDHDVESMHFQNETKLALKEIINTLHQMDVKVAEIIGQRRSDNERDHNKHDYRE